MMIELPKAELLDKLAQTDFIERAEDGTNLTKEQIVTMLEFCNKKDEEIQSLKDITLSKDKEIQSLKETTPLGEAKDLTSKEVDFILKSKEGNSFLKKQLSSEMVKRRLTDQKINSLKNKVNSFAKAFAEITAEK
jgi:hypothetical protein